jgi:hypothetical protein
MEANEYDKIVADNKLPSHQWAKNNVDHLNAVMEVADAERQLVKAVEIKNNRAGSKVGPSETSGPVSSRKTEPPDLERRVI